METLGKRLANFGRNFVWWGNFVIYKILNPVNVGVPKDVKKILVVELLFIGDTIVTTPAVRALKERFPGAEIHFMTLPRMDDVISGNPHISKILVHSKEGIAKDYFKIVRELKIEKYDMSVVFHPGSKLISKLLKDARIPFRVGCTRVGFLEGKGFWLHRKTRPTFKWKHKIDDNLDVVKTVGAYTKDKHLEIYSSPKSDRFVKDFLRKNKIKNFVYIHPCPQHVTHKWGEMRFAELADRLLKDYKVNVVFGGGPKDKDYVDQIISLMKCKAFNVAGCDLKKFFSFVKLSDYVISVDTSAMHVGAGFNKPTIALFGAGNPRIWRPYCDQSFVLFKERIACTSCMKHECRFIGKRKMECMKLISVNDVLKAVDRIGSP